MLLCRFFVIVLSVGLPFAMALSLRAEKSYTNLYNYNLTEFGCRFECYFTIEEMREQSQDSGILNASLPADFNPASRRDLIEGLSKAFPRFEIAADKSSPAVIRIIDKRLLERKDYKLASRLKATFSGTPHDLLGWLEKEGMEVSSPKGGMFGTSVGWSDRATSVRVRGHDGSIRQLLTAYLPLSDYRRVLWVADSSERQGKLKTLVSFRGSRPKRSAAISRTGKADFASGEIAYLKNEGTEEGVAAAFRFIDAQMKRDKPLPQVRWAMLLLGNEKATAGIPILLKHLEYCYTPWGLAGEAYPAVKALALMGPPAWSACLSQLRYEERPSRQRLLCQVLFDAQPIGDARKALQQELAKVKDVAQRKRLEAADKKLLELSEGSGIR